MNWLGILNQIFQIAIIPLIGACALYLVALINAKKKQIEEKTENEKAKEYLDMLNDTITKCVITTSQTYVEALKNKNAFDAEAQKAAFQMTYDAVMKLITADAQKYLIKIVGDLNTYIYNAIESEVVTTKRIYF